MDCSTPANTIVIAGFLAGVLLGFLFRNSDAERDQAIRGGFRHWFMRALYAPIWSARGLLLLVVALAVAVFALMLPGYMLSAYPLCTGSNEFHRLSFIVGALVGWFLRYLLWRYYLRRL